MTTYQPVDEWEAGEMNDEARAMQGKGGKCLFALLALVGVAMALPLGICLGRGKRKCSKCLGFKTVMNTDGSLEVCSECDGTGEVET
jgi:hypothetical protein